MQQDRGQQGLEYEECGAIQRPVATSTTPDSSAQETNTAVDEAFATTPGQSSSTDVPKWLAWLLLGVRRPAGLQPGAPDLLAPVNRPAAPLAAEKRFSDQPLRERIGQAVLFCCLVIFTPVAMIYLTHLKLEEYQQGGLSRGEYLGYIWVGNSGFGFAMLVAVLGLVCSIWPKLGDALFERWQALRKRFR